MENVSIEIKRPKDLLLKTKITPTKDILSEKGLFNGSLDRITFLRLSMGVRPSKMVSLKTFWERSTF